MKTRKPEALRLAEILEGDYCPDWFYEQGVDEVSAELLRQHTRIAELEAQLEAIGAGGVEPLRKISEQPAQTVDAVDTQWLAEMIMSDCGCSTRNQRLLDRIIDRIQQYDRASASPCAAGEGWGAARYRWLRINAIGAFRTNDGKGPVSVYHLSKIPAIPGIPEETDAAIDAARKQGATT